MALLQQIDADMAVAMKAGEAGKTGVLRLLKSSFKNEQIKLGHELSEDEAGKILVREAKQRRDSITAYIEAGRADLVAVEEAELEVIIGYLPEQLDEAALTQLIDTAIAEIGVTSKAQMGQVMAAVMKAAGAAADGATVSRLVAGRLS